MKTFLHVGCGPVRKAQTTSAFAGENWTELRFDIDPAAQPDIVGTMTNMSGVATGSVDAVFSSHNIEHLYAHEVPVALSEFWRVLRSDGFIVVTCPDLQSIAALVARGNLTESVYQSPSGPIAPVDIIYGHRPSLAAGNVYMAHRCGFTEKVLTGEIANGGFGSAASFRRGAPFFDLWTVATKSGAPEAILRDLAAQHFPR